MVDHKGQSLVEVAVFGSFLLLVLGFLLSQGLQYNYYQEVKMEAFRRALRTAAGSSISKQHTVDLRKDVHFPDPSDMFALGQRTEIRSSSGIIWSNNSNQLDFQTPETTPSSQYVFNPDSPLVSPVYKNYTTSDLEIHDGRIISQRNAILNGVTEPYYVGDVSQTRVYQPDPLSTKQVMVLMNTLIPDCEEEYCEKDILGSVEYNANRGGIQYWPVFNVTQGEVGQPPGAIAFQNDEAGQLNKTLGMQQVTNKVIHKDRGLTLNENADMRSSIEALNNVEHIEHVIMTRDGEDNQIFEFGDAEPSKTWITPKN